MNRKRKLENENSDVDGDDYYHGDDEDDSDLLHAGMLLF